MGERAVQGGLTRKLAARPTFRAAPRRAAPRAGDPRRLVYAVDSRGLLCGANQTYRNATLDLSGQPNLHYLNALDLLAPGNLVRRRCLFCRGWLAGWLRQGGEGLRGSLQIPRAQPT